MIINNLSIIFSSGKSSESRSIDYFQSISTVLHVENTALQTGDSHKGSYMPNKRVIMPAITFFFPLLEKLGQNVSSMHQCSTFQTDPNHLAALNPVFACQMEATMENQRTHHSTRSIMNESLVYKLLLISFAKILQWFSELINCMQRWQIESKNDNCLGAYSVICSKYQYGPKFYYQMHYLVWW